MKIVLGTWPISGDYGKFNEKKSKELLIYCFKKGYKEFDTAPNYGSGKAEAILGNVLNNKNVLINTKIGNNSEKIKSFNIFFLKKSFKESLKRLKKKSINILFLHNPRKIKNLKEILFYLKYLKKKKLIKNYGLSISKDYKYKKNFLNNFKIFQVDYNLIYQKVHFDKYYLGKAKIYCRSPFASGLLNSKKYKNFSSLDLRKGWLNSKRLKNIYKSIDKFKILKKYSIKELSLLFLKKSSFSKNIIFGCRTVSQFKYIEKIIFSKKNLSDKEFNLICEIYSNQLMDKNYY